MKAPAKQIRSLRAIFGLPLAVLLLGFFGLVIALTGDGWRDASAWIALAAPVALVGWAMRSRRT